MFAIIRMIIVGFIVGALGKLFIHNEHIGFIMTTIFGIAGSLAAGLVVHLISADNRSKPFHPAGFLASVVGAAVLLWLSVHFGWYGA